MRDSYFNCFLKILYIPLVCFLVMGCDQTQQQISGNSDMKLQQIDDIEREKWDSLAQKKIYFAHQSVGKNIIAGINDIVAEKKQVKLHIVPLENINDISEPVFVHSFIGHNMDPQSKIDGFSNVLENGLGDKVDIAILKMCFIDISPSTDVEKLFDAYRDFVSEITSKYENLQFVVCTVPIVVQDNSLKGIAKSFVKKIIGKTDYGHKANIAREEFNNRIRKEYSGKFPVFDIAKLEATTQDGQLLQFEKNGMRTLRMVPEYSSDGEHLNPLGRKFVAEQLLILLANSEHI